MRFTPFTFVGSQQLGTFGFEASGGTTGTFSSGGIDYSYLKFTSGSYTLNVTTGAEVDLLIVGGGAAGIVNGTAGSKGGGGGGVYVATTRLYKGKYNVSVGGGSIPDASASGSYITAYGLSYAAGGGSRTGEQGSPNNYPPGSNGPVCSGGADKGNGGGGGAAASGSNGFCSFPANRGQGGGGGEGLTYNFDGTPSVYGSGGGGGGGVGVGANGGGGGTNAGNGGGYSFGPTSAINGFGGGGGGEASSNTGGAGSGGHGVIIIRYRT